MADASLFSLLPRFALAALVAIMLWLPPWWAAGRLPEASATPLLRLLVAAGGALVGWLSVINLLGRQVQNSLVVAWIWLGLNAAAAAWLLWRRRDELSPRGLASTWRSWVPVVLLAIA